MTSNGIRGGITHKNCTCTYTYAMTPMPSIINKTNFKADYYTRQPPKRRESKGSARRVAHVRCFWMAYEWFLCRGESFTGDPTN